MKPRYLIATDYDGTLFRTFTPSPNGVDVYSAYEKSFTDMFGPIGARLFTSRKGENSAPYEMVHNMFDWYRAKDQYTDNVDFSNELEDTYQKMFMKARSFFDEHKETLQEYLPKTEEEITWNDENPLTTITQMVVGQKLKYLCNEIGQKDGQDQVWPQPTSGAIDFVNTLAQLQAEGVPIDFGVISSGHETFIKKSFDVWGLPHPSILVTDDDIRTRKHPQELHRRFKPGELPLALAHQKWLQMQGISAHTDGLMENARDTKQRIHYFGDDPHKDGGMAFHGRVGFGWYYESGAQAAVPQDSVSFFSHWNTVTQQLIDNKDFFDGRPFEAIFPIRTEDPEIMYQPARLRERR